MSVWIVSLFSLVYVNQINEHMSVSILTNVDINGTGSPGF